MEQVDLNKQVFVDSEYKKVIDTSFAQLATSASPNVLPPSISIEEFFQNYNDIFFQIPKLGVTNSHEYLVKTSSEYINANLINNDIQALIEEINSLQKQNLELNQQLVNTKISNG